MKNKNMIRNIMYNVIVFAIMIALGTESRAELYAYEGFDYAEGTDIVGQTGGSCDTITNPQNGGIPWTDATNGWACYSSGQAKLVATANTLEYTDSKGNVLTTSGAAVEKDVNNHCIYMRLFEKTWTDGDVVWTSSIYKPKTFIADKDNKPAFAFIMNENRPSNDQPTWGCGWEHYKRSDPKLEAYVLNARGASTTEPVIDETIFVVTKLVYHADTKKPAVYTWINPDLDSEPDTDDAISSMTTKAVTVDGLSGGADAIPIYKAARLHSINGSIGAETAFDELRIASTYAEVAPYGSGAKSGTVLIVN